MTVDAGTRGRLVGVFVAEAEESLASLRSVAAGRLEADGEALREFGRMAHGLKGAAASLGYSGLAQALHDLEDLALAIPRAGGGASTERLERVRGALDLLDEGVGRMAASGADAFPEDVLVPLLEMVAGAGAGPARTATPKAASGSAPTPTATASSTADSTAKTKSAPKSSSAAGAPATSNGAATSSNGAATAPDGDGRAAEVVERISVPAMDVDAALRLASSLARSAAQLHEALQRSDEHLARSAQALAASAGGLETIVASLRLLPAEAALSGLEEEVAGLAAHLDKKVGVGISGREVRADRRTLQTARGMIRHLVRNALDHGIEPPDDRVAAGKPEEGRVSVAVDAGDSTLHVTVCDDGAGFDTPAIQRELARRTGDAERVASLSDEDVLRAWAFEGGSTRAAATQISGRGLGLSAVAKMARAAGGSIRIRSVRGEGSIVDVMLPLEVYAVEALIVTARGRSFGIPLAAVERSVHIAASGAIHHGPTGPTLAVGETIVPLGALAEALGIGRASGVERFAVVVRSEGQLAALVVDEVGSVEGMVPSSVAGVAQGDALVTGIARLGDGAAAALLNPRLLVAGARASRSPRHGAAEPAARADEARVLEVVLAEDSLATREVLRVLLEEHGFRVRVAADGEEALQRVAERAPDVLVSDVNMPRRDGLSLTRALRARSGTERLPIVLLTSQDDEAMRAAGAAAGADAYLVKSRFNADVLEDTLTRIGVRGR